MVIGIGLSPQPPRPQAPVMIREDRPAYMVTEEKGFYGPNDHLYKAGEMIYWAGEPSIGMEPLNEMARTNMRKYLAKLDEAGRKMADKLGKHYNSLEEAFDSMFDNARSAEEQDGLISSIGARKPTPLLGQPKRSVSGIEAIDNSVAPPMLGTPRIPVGGQFDNDRSRMNSSVDGSRFV